MVATLIDGEMISLQPGQDVSGMCFESIFMTYADFTDTRDLGWFINNVVPRLSISPPTRGD